MKLLSSVVPSLFVAAVSLAPLTALANDADKAACAGLDKGDDCTRGDGSAGVCAPDESDQAVLTCEDDASADDSSDDDGGCSSTGTAPAPIGAALVGLALAGLLRRRS